MNVPKEHVHRAVATILKDVDLGKPMPECTLYQLLNHFYGAKNVQQIVHCRLDAWKRSLMPFFRVTTVNANAFTVALLEEDSPSPKKRNRTTSVPRVVFDAPANVDSFVSIQCICSLVFALH